jgi:DNA-binding MarR family transcriptional regulator
MPVNKRNVREKVARPASSQPRKKAPLTISRPEMLVNGSDRHFRRLVHSLFGFLARHEAVRRGHAARIGLVGIEYTTLISIRHLDAEEGDVNVNRVADHLHLSGAFVTTITNKLLKRGLIHKSIDPQDRRRVKLQVSEKGMRSWPSLPDTTTSERRRIWVLQSNRIPAIARYGGAIDCEQRKRRPTAGISSRRLDA